MFDSRKFAFVFPFSRIILLGKYSAVFLLISNFILIIVIKQILQNCEFKIEKKKIRNLVYSGITIKDITTTFNLKRPTNEYSFKLFIKF